MLCGIVLLLFIIYFSVNIAVGILWLWQFVESDHGTPGLVMPESIHQIDIGFNIAVVLCWVVFSGVYGFTLGYYMSVRRDRIASRGEEGYGTCESGARCKSGCIGTVRSPLVNQGTEEYQPLLK